ncbi:MAG: response regulator transcription factor [Pyrinomonadaceae bacterium]|nr:response regulator transcription factor [Pyrinomonadaceae bacterium]
MSAPDPNPIRVMIVDDHPIVSAGLRMLLESDPALSVVGEAGNSAAALALAVETQPDVILLDLDLGGESGLDILPQLLSVTEKARVIILTGLRAPETHHRALQLGAMGLVFKEKTSEILIKAIRRVHAGEVWFDRSMMGTALSKMSRAREAYELDPEVARIESLTDRECEVIMLVGEGLKNKQIAGRLYISETTVRHHLTSIFDKLQVTDRLELLIYAYRHRLVDSSRKPAPVSLPSSHEER